MTDHITNRGKIIFIFSYYISRKRLYFLQLFQLLLVSPIGMPSTYHTLRRKVVCHCLRRGVGILPLNGKCSSLHSWLLERKACSIVFGTLGRPLVEFFFNYVIAAFLTEMLVVKKRSIVVVLNAEVTLLV